MIGELIVGAIGVSACLVLIVGYAFVAERLIDYIRRVKKEDK